MACFDEKKTSVILHSLSSLKQLKTLVLDGIVSSTDHAIELSLTLDSIAPSIRLLSLANCSLSDHLNERFLRSLSRASGLQTLNMSRNELGYAGCQSISKILRKFPLLKSLDLHSNSIVNADPVISILPPSLEELDISENRISENNIETLSGFFKHSCFKLKSLKLSVQNITSTRMMHHFLRNFEKLLLLEEIVLFNEEKEIVQPFFHILTHLPHLKKLSIHGNLDDNFWDSLGLLENITHLSLDSTSIIQDGSFGNLCEAISHLHHLRYLSFQNNFMDLSHVRELLAVLIDCKSFIHLDIRSNCDKFDFYSFVSSFARSTNIRVLM
ncbi:hypothetical protein ADUPG1_013471 [Aduncisulcus paluster]|uniref:Uncharacterized protein n=1 Tax=Aduncisulcus paluster TaxID=2918883 RepID=A0ABQ5K318_9EUKA|nr:hypothetical protein ADUPG1_013471 [Aduncisulcus paluster]